MRGAVAGSSAGSLNSTRIDARGHTLQLGRNGSGGGVNQSQQWSHNQSQLQGQGEQRTGPVPSHALHPNHIMDVFPDALSALTKTEEHSYSASVRPSAHADHSHASHNHSISQHNHNPYAPTAASHHKVPLRMPVGPSGAPQTQQGNLFDQVNMSGMDDSVYAQPNQSQLNGTTNGGGGGGGGPTPLLSAALASDRVVPLQRENLRLVRSNNALQAHLVAEGERIDEKEKAWAVELRTVKTKYTDLQFLHAQKTRKIANVSNSMNLALQRDWTLPCPSVRLRMLKSHVLLCLRFVFLFCVHLFVGSASKRPRSTSCSNAWSRFCLTEPRTSKRASRCRRVWNPV